MKVVSIVIFGEPKSKQSARFYAKKIRGRTIVKSYQKKEVVNNENYIALQAKRQLPYGFTLYRGATKVKALFVFPFPKNTTKSKLNALANGVVFHKTTKPDLTDNLMKGTMDALNGIVFKDDAIIAEVESSKIYGLVPRIELTFSEL